MQFPDLPTDTPDTPISFHFEDVAFDLPDQTVLTDWLLAVTAVENKPFVEVNYIFCSDEHLRDINVEYLDHDYYTDVITFPYADDAVHGDVFISSERVADNAQTQGVSFAHELCRVMAHGVLHLAGYSDKEPEKEAVMRQKEDFYLQKLPTSILS
jgi:probable rRNA maturation factor